VYSSISRKMQLFAWNIIESYKKLDGGNFPPRMWGKCEETIPITNYATDFGRKLSFRQYIFFLFLPVFQYFIEKNGNF
jgi:hypothetical protein